MNKRYLPHDQSIFIEPANTWISLVKCEFKYKGIMSVLKYEGIIKFTIMMLSMWKLAAEKFMGHHKR
jgi:hypothetical protein